MAENDVGSQVLTDTILDELSKVSEIEKMVFKVQDHSYFTSSEVHNLEARVDGLQEKVDEKESTTLDGDRKYGDNVTSDKDKINPILKTDERKRYENIGVEFAIGAERVFNELKKAEELKEKMRIKKIENIDVEQEQKKEKDEKGNKRRAVRGIKYFDNDMVNFTSGVFSFLLSLSLGLFLHIQALPINKNLSILSHVDFENVKI